MAHLKRSIVEVKAADNFLAHALLITIARVEKVSKYDSYRRGWKILPVVRDLLEKTCIDLASGGGTPELARFQEHFSEYKIVVYQGLRCDKIMFERLVESIKNVSIYSTTTLKGTIT